MHSKSILIASVASVLALASIAQAALEPISPVSTAVKPIAWSTLPSSVPSDIAALRIRTALRNANRYAVTTWWNTAKNYDAQTGAYLSFGGVSEGNIRPSSSEAYSLAIALKLGAYDAASTGVSQADATAITLKLIRSLAYQHKANTTGGWGDEWQSAFWASLSGTAGWLMWDDLSPTDREYVRKMVEYEANRFVGYQVPSYRSTAGAIISSGDSKAEENAWNAHLLQLATAMMPSHPAYRAWLYKNLQLMASGFSRPADTSSNTVVNGAPISSWLSGSNANADYTVINHSRIHPDYMVTFHQNLSALLVYPMSGRAAPEVATWNAGGVYDALVDLTFTAGASYEGTDIAIASPGGTIYKSGGADLYFPQGNDWGTMRRANVLLADVMADAFNLDGTASVPASTWEGYHAQYVIDQQARSSDGRTYVGSGEDTYAGREEAVAFLLGKAWWAKWIVHNNLDNRTAERVAIVVDNKDQAFTMPSGTWTTYTSGADKLGSSWRGTPTGAVSAKARFTINVPVAGSYKIYAWWPVATGASSSTTFVTFNGSANSVAKDQRSGGGAWNYLGQYTFPVGSSNYVEVSGSSTGIAAADAIMVKPASLP